MYKSESSAFIFGLILCAGYSERMKAFKPLLPIGENTVMEHVISAMQTAGINNIIAVTGHNRKSLVEILDKYHVTEAFNKDFHNGMFSSVQAGIKMAASIENCNGVLLTPVDYPLISSETYKKMYQIAVSHSHCFAVPSYQFKKGHPLFVSSHYFKEILSYRGDGGLREITRFHKDNIMFMSTEDEGVILDMDEQRAYKEILVKYDERKKVQFYQ